VVVPDRGVYPWVSGGVVVPVRGVHCACMGVAVPYRGIHPWVWVVPARGVQKYMPGRGSKRWAAVVRGVLTGLGARGERLRRPPAGRADR
jgi:hypothetical protein